MPRLMVLFLSGLCLCAGVGALHALTEDQQQRMERIKREWGEYQRQYQEFKKQTQGKEYKDMSEEQQRFYIENEDKFIRFSQSAQTEIKGWEWLGDSAKTAMTIPFVMLENAAKKNKEKALASVAGANQTSDATVPKTDPVNKETPGNAGSNPQQQTNPVDTAIDAINKFPEFSGNPSADGKDPGQEGAPSDMKGRRAMADKASDRLGKSAGNMAGNLLGGMNKDDGGFTGSGKSNSGGLGATAGAKGAPSFPGGMAGPRRDFLASASAGYKDSFDRIGVILGPGGSILRRDGSPATEAELAALRADIDSQPRVLASRPDFHSVHPLGHFSEVKRAYDLQSEQRGEAFKHIGKEGKDLQWNKTCEAVSGECNKYAKEKKYNRNNFVSPETLENIWEKALKAVKEHEASRKQGGPPAGVSRDRAKGIWGRLAGLFDSGNTADRGFGPAVEVGDAVAEGLGDGSWSRTGIEAPSDGGATGRKSGLAPSASAKAGIEISGAASRATSHWLWAVMAAGAGLAALGFQLRRRD